MTALLTTALFLAAAALSVVVVARDGAKLLRNFGEWDAELGRIDRDMLRDPAAFRLRPTGDATRGVPVRPAPAPRLGVAA